MGHRGYFGTKLTIARCFNYYFSSALRSAKSAGADQHGASNSAEADADGSLRAEADFGDLLGFEPCAHGDLRPFLHLIANVSTELLG